MTTYSVTQISHYLACPRRYRHRYLDGWQEKDSRAAMLFGRAFEKALAAYFRREDAAAAFFTEWSTYRESELVYSGNDTWDRLLHEGFQLLDRFAQDDRVRIPRPRRNQQIKFTCSIHGGNDFVAYVDAIGRVDGTECLIEWKTTSARYSESLTACWRLTRSSSATPGSPVSPKSPRWSSCANVWLRCNTCGQRLPKPSARNLQPCSRTPFSRSIPDGFSPTLASGFPRTLV